MFTLSESLPDEGWCAKVLRNVRWLLTEPSQVTNYLNILKNIAFTVSRLVGFTAEISLYKSEYISHVTKNIYTSVAILPAQPKCEQCLDNCQSCWNERCPSRHPDLHCNLSTYYYCRGLCRSCYNYCK
jgi:hypothetical protein